MKKIFSILLVSLFLSGCTIPFSKTKKTALDIKSNSPAIVYLNEDAVGSTPFYKDNLKPGEYTVKLELESDPKKVWSTEVSLKSQLLTSIQKNFAETIDMESHFSLSLKPINKKNTSLTIIALPDSSVVKIDGQPTGFSPTQENEISPGDHQVVLSSPGYRELPIPIKIIQGHELIVSAQLAKDKTAMNQLIPVASSSATPDKEAASPPKEKTASVSSTIKEMVKITKTGTGWLRVRKEPTTATDNEVDRVDVGKTYPLLDSTKKDWYEIEYVDGKSGWISSNYSQVVKK